MSTKELNQLHLALLEKKKEATIACINSLYVFFLNFWHVVSHDDLKRNWHIKYICDELQLLGMDVINRRKLTNDLIINIPPGMSKSTMVSQMLPIWLWLHDPSIVVISSSYSQDLSTDHCLKSKSIFKSEKFQDLFQPYYKKRFGKEIILTKDNEKDFRNNFTGARFGTSTGGSITGKHAHLIIRDDPINPEQAESETYRLRCNRFNDRTLSSRKKDKEVTPTITVMQRLHVDDSTGHDLKKSKKKTKLICLPGEVTEDICPPELKDKYIEGLLDPVRLSWEVLDDMKDDLENYGYAGQVLQKPVIAEGLLYPESELNWFTMDELEGKKPDGRIAACDVADKGNDYFSAPFADVYNDRFFITDVVFSQDPVEITEGLLASTIIDKECETIRIESNNGGRTFAINIKRLIKGKSNCDVKTRHTTANKETRILLKSGFVKKHFWFRSDYKKGSPYDKFITQLTNYLRLASNQKDDAPDSVTILAEFIDSIGLLKEKKKHGSSKSALGIR